VEERRFKILVTLISRLYLLASTGKPKEVSKMMNYDICHLKQRIGEVKKGKKKK
jgi:hypothetical protein